MSSMKLTNFLIFMMVIGFGKGNLLTVIKSLSDNVCIFQDNQAIARGIEAVKDLSKRDVSSFVSTNVQGTLRYCRKATVVLFDDTTDTIEMKLSKSDFTKQPLIIVTKMKQKWEGLLKGKVNVNQLVYIFDLITDTMFETYTIGDITVNDKLGSLVQGKLRIGNPSVEDRRLNFRGIHLKAMVSEQVPLNIVPDNYPEVTQFHESNATYDVTKIVRGSFRQVLETMAARMNFTFSQYQRKDGYWASPVKLDNGMLAYVVSFAIGSVWFLCFAGTEIWTGMADNVLSGEADLISASLTLTPERASVLSFLPALGLEKYMLIIVDKGIEDISWRTFLVILRPEIWYATMTMAFSFWIIVVSVDWMTTKKFPTLEVHIILNSAYLHQA